MPPIEYRKLHAPGSHGNAPLRACSNADGYQHARQKHPVWYSVALCPACSRSGATCASQSPIAVAAPNDPLPAFWRCCRFHQYSKMMQALVALVALAGACRLPRIPLARLGTASQLAACGSVSCLLFSGTGAEACTQNMFLKGMADIANMVPSEQEQAGAGTRHCHASRGRPCTGTQAHVPVVRHA